MVQQESLVRIPAAGVVLEADVQVPEAPPDQVPSGVLPGLVLFAHGSGSSRGSPRNRMVAARLRAEGFATILADLLTPGEELVDERTARLRFDIGLLAGRLAGILDWVREQETLARLPVGMFGASTGAGAALVAAARRPDAVRAVVSRGGRPDLAGPALAEVQAPTLLIVGSLDATVLDLNERAGRELPAPWELRTIPGATHLFPEAGALEQVAAWAGEWFAKHLPG